MFKTLLRKLRKENQYAYRSGWDLGQQSQPTFIVGRPIEAMSLNSSSTEKKKNKRIVKKPVEIFKEIISEEPKVNLNDLDKQIEIVNRRMKILQEEIGMDKNSLGDETEAIEFLKARKKYIKNKDSFGWAIATFPSIEKLCKKYEVCSVGFESYYKNVPREAIDELEKFLKAYKKVRSDKPVLKLIIDEGGKETKKDPILLASSPFGKWFYILGAWDKEVEIVDDLVYNGK